MKQPIPTKPHLDAPARPTSARGPQQVFCLAALIGAVLLVFLYDMLFGVTSETTLFTAVGVGLYLTGAAVAAFA